MKRVITVFDKVRKLKNLSSEKKTLILKFFYSHCTVGTKKLMNNRSLKVLEIVIVFIFKHKI